MTTEGLESTDGTELDPQSWQAIYNSPGYTGPLVTGRDFYNFFVDSCAGPDSSSDSSAAAATATWISSSEATPSATLFPDSAYSNNTDIFQPNLYSSGGGFWTGYFLKDGLTAVLSIPTFNMYADDLQTSSDIVQRFFDLVYATGLSKVLVDLQQNLGGDTLLVVDTFKYLFSFNDAFHSSRIRAQSYADIIGNIFVIFYQDRKYSK